MATSRLKIFIINYLNLGKNYPIKECTSIEFMVPKIRSHFHGLNNSINIYVVMIIKKIKNH